MNRLWLPQGDHRKGWGLLIAYDRAEDAGNFVGGGHKLCWHTTEGGSYSSVVRTLKEKRAAVHFVIDPRIGRVIQMIPLDKAGRGLAHPSGPETNRANVIQVEIVGYAKESGQWSDEDYRKLAALAVLIEHRFPIPRRTTGEVTFAEPRRLSGPGFYRAAGHCGHCHVPGNDHYDPGKGFKGKKLRHFMKEFD